MRKLFRDWNKAKKSLLKSLITGNFTYYEREFPWHRRWLRKFQDWLYRHGLRKTTPYDDLRKIMISMIRNVMPGMIANHIIGVQPMSEQTGGKIFTFKTVSGEDDPPPKEGDRRHVFGEGVQIFYGGQWIDIDIYFKIKRAGL